MSRKTQRDSALRKLGYSKLYAHQRKPIDSICDGNDTFVIARTGSGKSAIATVPALMHENLLSIVIVPTTSLMHDQVASLKALGVKAEYLSGENTSHNSNVYEMLHEHQIVMLYVTPERLQDKYFRGQIAGVTLWMIVVDECHCILDWGNTFRKSYLKISVFIDSLKHRPVVVAMTATAPPEYRDQISMNLHMKKTTKCFVTSLYKPHLSLIKEELPDKNTPTQLFLYRLKRLVHYINKYGDDGSVVVYCSTRSLVDQIANRLEDIYGEKVVRCHAAMEESKRTRHEINFMGGKARIMVATTAFGMGVNKSDVRLVVHFNLPLSIIDYYQQVGRAGRDGEKARAILLYHKDDVELNRALIRKEEYSPQLQKWLNEQLEGMRDLAESEKCLMQQVLNFLGEKKDERCSHCTNCQKRK